jgi:hypothetical protein
MNDITKEEFTTGISALKQTAAQVFGGRRFLLVVTVDGESAASCITLQGGSTNDPSINDVGLLGVSHDRISQTIQYMKTQYQQQVRGKEGLN